MSKSETGRAAWARAERMIETARKRGQHIETANGTLCVVCAAGTDPESVQRCVGAWEGCYNCSDTPFNTIENNPKRECFCHPAYTERDHLVFEAGKRSK